VTAPTQTRSYSLGPVLPHVKKAAELVGNRFGLTSILGWRATARDMTGHPAGRALDFMCTPAQGDQIAAYLIGNHEPLGIDYIIWKQRSWDPDDGQWQPMEDRGSPTQNHMDHVHANFKLLGGSGQLSDFTGATVTDVPVNEGLVDKLNPFDNWGRDLQAIGVKLLAVGGALALIVIGVNRTVSSEK
jgi:hypothetical protein